MLRPATRRALSQRRNESDSGVRKQRSTLWALTTSQALLAGEVDSPAKHAMNVTPGSFAEATKVRANLWLCQSSAGRTVLAPCSPTIAHSNRLFKSPILRSRCFPLFLI